MRSQGGSESSRQMLNCSVPINEELGGELRRTGSLRLSRSSESPAPDRTSRKDEHENNELGRNEADSRNLLAVPDDNTRSKQQQQQEQKDTTASTVSVVVPEAGGSPSRRAARPTRHSAPATVAPAPEYLARSLLQLGCPVVSMPKPRGGVGSEHNPQASSDSDDSTTSHHAHHPQHQSNNQHQASHAHQTQGQQTTMHAGYGLPKVQVSGPPNTPESLYTNGSAGSIGARSAPSTPLQGGVGSTPQQQQNQQQQQPQQQQAQQIGGSQLTVSPPPKSPSHAALRCKDSQLSKPLSRSTPSMTAGGVTITTANVSRSSTRSSPTSTSSARQKKFHRHFSQSAKFSDQVTADERVLNYYSCALVGDILLQGHLYITPNYFAFYSNVFGYVTKLLIPTVSVLKISKEKTARIIPNAVAVATVDERHVFCSLLSRDSTFKLMKQVWDAALEARDPVANVLPLPVEAKLLTPDPSLVDDSEVNPEEDDSSMSESGTDLTSRPPTVCTDTDALTTSIPRLSLPSSRLEQIAMPKMIPPENNTRMGGLRSLIWCEMRPATIIAILVALLAALYVSAALMMLRIDRLHTAYINHPLASPERFTQDRLMQYLTSNLDQIVKVRQSLQTLSQQFVTMDRESEAGVSGVSGVSGGPIEADESPS
ncbi:GRAM domain-containing protein 2B-like isoform X2 [Venturia canescens]|uniref:GRAM domain-containing protein 2B-like isoform X2 n=1 Tax=Venturia canescens TaxID=32260 RepID=UPI001C9D291F|nr:GRAM domain-containing protein 2B-like isoform X2 [Venturia canescens]